MSVSRLKISPSGAKSIFLLQALQDDTFSRLVKACSAVPASLGRAPFIAQLNKDIPDLTKADAEGLVNAFFALNFSRGTAAKDVESFVSDVLDSLALIAKADPALSNVDDRRLRTRLITIFNIPNLFASAKAIGLFTAHQRVFTNARLFTDVRPIFGQKEEELLGAVVFHTLKIEVQSNEDPDEIFVAMDDLDVERLINVLQRARAKGAKLKQFLESSHLPQVDVESD